jgi:four helix bundle protein
MPDNKPARICSFRDLKAYQLAYQLALEIHKRTKDFPGFERIELASQLRRAVVSVPLNIAEGYGRKRSPEEFKRFLVIALGSCNEVSVILDLARDLEYLDGDEYARWASQIAEVGKMLTKLVQVWR